MRRMVTISALAILALSAAQADPLAEARSGQLQCYKPDMTNKTCMALSGYSFTSSGQITNNADVLLSPQPLVVMRTSSPVFVKGEAVCGVMRTHDLDTAQILVNGAPLPEDKAAGVRSQLAAAFQPQIGKEICTTYAPAGDKLSAHVAVDGVANPAFDQQVVWVKPEDGFRVSP